MVKWQSPPVNTVLRTQILGGLAIALHCWCVNGPLWADEARLRSRHGNRVSRDDWPVPRIASIENNSKWLQWNQLRYAVTLESVGGEPKLTQPPPKTE
eukprot:s2538_g14.t1